ncbi:MAG: hypothetical protein IJ740_01170 [Ruminococcus sp.]|nr:hypothetical protein [Ruminococcus sp.]
MKRILAAMLAAAAAMSMLAACGDDKSSSKASSDEEEVNVNAGAAVGEAKEENADSCAKSVFTAAATYCAKMETAGEPVTASSWAFNLSSPDPDEEIETGIINALAGDVTSGMVNIYFKDGAPTKVEYTSKNGAVGEYPK